MTTYKNREGIWGWLSLRRRNLERYFYILHRITGVVILVYLYFHILTVGNRVSGREVWELVMSSLHNPIVYTGEFLLVAVVFFHGLNGLRLIFGELGLPLGRPHRPTYPYRPTSLGTTPRLVMLGLMVVGGILLAVAGIEYLLFVGG